MHLEFKETKNITHFLLFKANPHQRYQYSFALRTTMSERKLFSWTYLLKNKPRRTKILISPIWNKTLKVWDTLFELIQIEAQCNKNYFKCFLITRSNKEKEQQRKGTAKATSKYEKYVYYIFTENVCATCSPIQVSVFLQKCIKFREKQLKFSDFEDNIIPSMMNLSICTFYKNKLYKRNKPEISKKNKKKLRKFWGWEILNYFIIIN